MTNHVERASHSGFKSLQMVNFVDLRQSVLISKAGMIMTII